MVYHIEIALLFATLAVLGPLVKLGTYRKPQIATDTRGSIGLADLPT
jgi:BCD family chlorophyll transporter-like MFS transporter